MTPLKNSKPFLLIASILILTSTFYGFKTTSGIKPEKKIVEATKKLSEEKQAKKIKIALLLDTSNSMDGLIDQAKAQLWTLVGELAKAKCDGEKPQVEIALYEYGNDRLSSREGYIRMVTPLTYDLDKISEDLFKLTTQGGSEFCGHVIQTACRQLDWSPDGGDYQVIFIAGNEPFTQGGVNYKESCAFAQKNNIIVNTIYCGPFDEGIRGEWKTGADLTTGTYSSIEQDRKTVFIPSPYDDKIAELNSKLNSTYIEYGSVGKAKKENQQRQDANASAYGQGNMVKRAVSKSTHIYKNDSWDLVDASEEKSFDINKVEQKELPDNMKNMTAQEKTKYIAKQKEERNKIKTEISNLNKQRETYIAQKNKNNNDDKTLDNAMLKSIRKQASTKNLTF